MKQIFEAAVLVMIFSLVALGIARAQHSYTSNVGDNSTANTEEFEPSGRIPDGANDDVVFISLNLNYGRSTRPSGGGNSDSNRGGSGDNSGTSGDGNTGDRDTGDRASDGNTGDRASVGNSGDRASDRNGDGGNRGPEGRQ